jgi:hypothetical protein
MARGPKLILWLYIAYNLVLTVALVVRPEIVDGPYLGGELTPTRRFQWFSVASMHMVIAAATWVSISLPRAKDRRKLHLINAGFCLWDAATQWLYWGAAIGMAARDLHVNAGVAAGVGVMLLWVAWRDRGREGAG